MKPELFVLRERKKELYELYRQTEEYCSEFIFNSVEDENVYNSAKSKLTDIEQEIGTINSEIKSLIHETYTREDGTVRW